VRRDCAEADREADRIRMTITNLISIADRISGLDKPLGTK